MAFKRISLSVAPLPSTGYTFDCAGISRWFADVLRSRRPSHERLFNQYVEARRIAEGTAEELRGRLRSVKEGAPYLGDVAADLRILGERRIDVGIAAENLLMPLDALLGGLRFRLFSKDLCRDDGPDLRHGVTVDRALDAIGNYVRHGFEWHSHDYKDTWPNEQQTRSIRPLAQLHAPYKIEGAEDAYKEFTSISLPPAFVLDLLGDFETTGPAMTYRSIEGRVYHAAVRTAENRFK